MSPQISVIVPVYNAERWLHRCIDSILKQTLTDFELLLIDDGSTDGSPAICDEYAVRDSRVRVFHKPNGGVSSARNLGLDNAHGEWIMFVDSDDSIEPEMLKSLYEKAKAENADMIFGDFWFDYPEKKEQSKTYDWGKQGKDGLKEYIATTWTCLWGNLQRKQLYDDYNLRCPESIIYCEDFHLMVRLCYFSKKIAKVSRPFYHYRQQETSIMHTFNEKCVADGMTVYNEIIDFFKQHSCYEQFKDVMAWRSLNICLQMLFDPNKYGIIKNFNPDKKHYIFSCPMKHISMKARLMFWFITHGMHLIAENMVSIWAKLGRK